jgi:conserved hypothetical protein TIGR00046
VLPAVGEPAPLLQVVADAGLPGDRYYLSPLATVGIGTMTAPINRRILIAVGPEGGWSARDLQALDGAGFIGIRLGPRILRTETAGLAAIASLQARLGDLG